MKRILYFLLVLSLPALAGSRATAQNLTYAEKVQRYIAAYKDLAIQEQQRSGIPAAITLAQGILESGAGESELATEAANHFGIKCKSNWTGETYNHDDDAPEECFRKYNSAEASYRDHSDFLKSAGRYQPCFAQSTTDYAAWAYQLRTCGYATSPTYAQRLIKIIEDYKLQQYTYAALDSQDPLRTARAGEVVPENDAPAPTESTPVLLGERPSAQSTAPGTEATRLSAHSETPEEARAREQKAKEARNAADAAVATTKPAVNADGTTVKDGRRGFYARKGDVLLEDAIRHRIRYAKLLEINGIPDEPLSADRFIYLEKATTTRIEHDVDVIAGHDETARLATTASTRTNEAPAVAPMVASAAGVVPQPTRRVAEVTAPLVEDDARTDRQPDPADATAAPETTAPAINATEEPTQNTTTPVPTVVESNTTESPVPTERRVEEATMPTEIPANTAVAEQVAGMVPASQEPQAANSIENTTNANTAVAPAASGSDGFNIAAENAVEEEANDDEEQHGGGKPVAEPEEPKDEMSRLKSRFDKAVYAPSKPAAKPIEQTAPAPETVAPVKAAPAAASNTSKTRYYTVQKGDTAFGIAKKHGITVRQLQDWNGLSMDSGVPLGKKLKVQP